MYKVLVRYDPDDVSRVAIFHPGATSAGFEVVEQLLHWRG